MKTLSTRVMTLLMVLTVMGVRANAPVKEVGDRYRPGSLTITPADAARITGVTAPVTPAFPAGGAAVAVNTHITHARLVKTAEEDDAFDMTDSLDDRVKRLEQQTQNIANMNMPQELSRLQQEVAELRGLVQQQQHALEQLNKQVTVFYQDLDGRLRRGSPAAAESTSVSPAASHAESSPITPPDLAEAKSYQQAFSALTKRDYAAAKQGFKNYLTQFSGGKFVADAHYWLGEIYLLDKNLPAATDEFNLILKQYPKAGKVPDARLKLAMIYVQQGRIEQAKQALREVKRLNPNSTAAQLATIQLQQLEQAAQ